MSLQVITTRLDKLLGEERPRIILLAGEWGTGKTFNWNAAIKRRRAKTIGPALRYAYVSLFGLGSLAEVRRRISEEMLTTFRLPDTDDTVGNRIEVDSWKFKPLQVMKLLPIIPYLSKLEGLANELSFAAVRNAVICFDDLERASPQFRLADLLGLATFLREQRNCRVALLTNSNKIEIDDKKVFDRYLERAVDETLVMQPTPQEAVQVALSGDSSPAAKTLAICTTELGLVNIRVISKLFDMAKELQTALQPFHPGVLEQATRTLALFGRALFIPSDKFPTFEYLEAYGSKEWAAMFAGAGDAAKMTPECKQRREWHQLLQTYGRGATDDFDREIAYSVRRGYMIEATLKTLAVAPSEQLQSAEQKKLFTDAMDLLYASFDSNEAQIIQEMQNVVANASAHINLAEMHAVFYVLDQLSGEEVAMKALESFIAANQHRYEIFNLTSDPFGELTSPPFRQRIAAEYARHIIPIPLNAALDRIDFGRGWATTDVERIAAASEEEIYQLLRQTSGEKLRKRLKTLTGIGQLQGDVVYGQIHRKVVNVLKRISEESVINALRLRHFLPKQEAAMVDDAESSE